MHDVLTRLLSFLDVPYLYFIAVQSNTIVEMQIEFVFLLYSWLAGQKKFMINEIIISIIH